MVYPEIDLPMYEPLKDISSELFLPNIQLIENNSITLLETNQKFIESYMVGLNHEFARELLWREYPTDQRGSYFRQFWDVRGFLAGAGADPEALRERLRDIPELHRWSTDTALGDHDHREAQGDKEDEVVLVIRGELLKKYPTAVIYAHRAAWERTSGGAIDKTQAAQAGAALRRAGGRPAARPGQDAAVRGQGRPRHLLLRLRPHRREGARRPGRQRRGRPGLVLRDQGAAGRAALRPRSAAGRAAGGDPHLERPRLDRRAEHAHTPGAFLRVGEKTVTLTDPGSAERRARPQYDEDSRFALARRHARRRAGLHPLPGAGADGGARRRDAQEAWVSHG